MNNRSYKYFDLVVTLKFDLVPYHFRGWCSANRGSAFGVRRSGFVPLRCVWHFVWSALRRKKSDRSNFVGSPGQISRARPGSGPFDSLCNQLHFARAGTTRRGHSSVGEASWLYALAKAAKRGRFAYVA